MAFFVHVIDVVIVIMFYFGSGPTVVLVGSTPLLFSQRPLLLYNGELTCQTASGKTSDVTLSTHSFLKSSAIKDAKSSDDINKQVNDALMLKRWFKT